VDSVTVEVASALEANGIRCILLKGPTIATWLYGSGEVRPYCDTDLLVNPDQLDRAGGVLSDLGFDLRTDDRVLDAFAEPHALVWRRGSEGTEVDLHWRLPGVGVSADLAWHQLSAQAVHLDMREHVVEALAIPARLLHLVLHAVQSGVPSGPHGDVEQALARCDLAMWGNALHVARELQALEPFAVGLRACPGGSELAHQLRLPEFPSSPWRDWVQPTVRGALRLRAIRDAPKRRAKVRLVMRALFPSAAYLRAIDPVARRGRLGLFRAYGMRILAIATRLVPAVLAARATSRREEKTTTSVNRAGPP